MPDFTQDIEVASTVPRHLLTFVQDPPAGTLLKTGNYTLTIRVTVSGNSQTATCQSLLVINCADIALPAVTCPSDKLVCTDVSSCLYTLPDYRSEVTVSDNVTPTSLITKSQSPAAGTQVGPGTHVITITATDLAGNVKTCAFNVIVSDCSPPECTGPSSFTYEADQSICGYVMPDLTGSFTFTDNCDTSPIISKTQTPAAGAFLPIGTTPGKIEIRDAGGNINACNFNVTVTCTPQPSVSIGANPTQVAAAGQNSTISWNSSNINGNVSITPTIGSQAGNAAGSQAVAINDDTTFIIGGSNCCASALASVTVTVPAPCSCPGGQPSSLSISGLSGIDTAAMVSGVCLAATVDKPAWDGTGINITGTPCNWNYAPTSEYPTDTDWRTIGQELDAQHRKVIVRTVTILKEVTGGCPWSINISASNVFPGQGGGDTAHIWLGTKTTGVTPRGTYTRTGGCSPGPATLVVS